MILLPTLDRIDKLVNFLMSARDNGMTVPGLVIVDEKDFERNRGAYARVKEQYMNPNWEMRVTKAITMGDKVREVWHEVENLNWVGLLNDDHVVKRPHDWDMVSVSALTGRNFISTNDGWRSPQLPCGLTAWSMPLLKVCGFPIFPEGLQHLFIDNLWQLIGEHTGCHDFVHNVTIEHHHVFKREGEMDQTHQKTYSRGWEQGSDAQVFQKFMQTEFANLVRRINDFLLLKEVPGDHKF